MHAGVARFQENCGKLKCVWLNRNGEVISSMTHSVRMQSQDKYES